MSERLAHALWLGGSPCSGKSTVADRISARFGFQVYDCDDAWIRHGKAASAISHPLLHRLSRADAEEIRLRRSVARQVSEAIGSYQELFPLIVADIEAMPAGTPVVAVGAALLPELVMEAGFPLHRALWMIPTEALQRHHYGRREWRHEILGATTDPDRAWDNWMRRDAAFAREIARQAKTTGGRLIVVDGAQDIDAIEREVVALYGLV